MPVVETLEHLSSSLKYLLSSHDPFSENASSQILDNPYMALCSPVGIQLIHPTLGMRSDANSRTAPYLGFASTGTGRSRQILPRVRPTAINPDLSLPQVSKMWSPPHVQMWSLSGNLP